MRYHWNHDALEMKLLHYKKIQIGENWFKYDGKPLLMEKLELVIGGGGEGNLDKVPLVWYIRFSN